MFYLGLDYSTQQLKSVVVDLTGRLLLKETVDFDRDLPHYGTCFGVLENENSEAMAPSLMWIEATDVLLQRLSKMIDLSKVVGLSGSAQQHTTIFWRRGISDILRHYDSSKPLRCQLESMFSKPLSPTWMDSTTSYQCNLIEQTFGGKYNLQDIITSTLAERFSAPQIWKAFQENINLEEETGFITLVSNGMCSLFCGKLVGIDASDASGTGLVRAGSLMWEEEICSMISKGLISKLGPIIKSDTIVGDIDDYFVKRYNISGECKVIAFTGDNPSSVVGMQLQKHDICFSLGTSDTMFVSLPEKPRFVTNIPVFVFTHPYSIHTYVTLLCYKNGSQIRQSVCNQYCNGNWSIFTEMLAETPPGNDGIIGLFYDLEEITPSCLKGRFFADISNISNGFILENNLKPSVIVRALIEGQILAKYMHFSAVNSDTMTGTKDYRILVTGGASVNPGILQIISDVFNNEVQTMESENSAVIGSVCRVVAATQNATIYQDFVKGLCKFGITFTPKSHDIYRNMIEGFSKVLSNVYRYRI